MNINNVNASSNWNCSYIFLFFASQKANYQFPKHLPSPSTPENIQSVRQNNSPALLVCPPWACYGQFSSPIIQTEQYPSLLRPDMQSCYFFLKEKKIFCTILHRLSISLLLQLLRKCDMLCLPDEATYFRSIYTRIRPVFLCMLILYYGYPFMSICL